MKPEDDKPKIFIRTFGCQMNDYDSERMYRLMEREGWRRTAVPDDADLIIVNTCSVRDKPEHKALSEVGFMRRYKQRRPETIVAIAGCVAQQFGDRLLKRVQDLDLVIGTHAIDKLPRLVEKCRARPVNTWHVTDTEWDYDSLLEFEKITPTAADGAISWKGTRASGFVPIMRGCDMGCSYCIVPQVRGREISRPMDDILAEVRSLAEAGVRDVTLLGQIVNRYGRGITRKNIFHELLEAVSKVDGVARLRFASSHPSFITNALVECFARLPAVASHLHLPVQSGSDRVLKEMRRGHTIEKYLEKVEKLRGARPEISITTDFIVGYPGETESDFQATLDLIENVRFDSLFAFKYSPRPGTPAEVLGDPVPEELKAERLERVHAAAKPIILSKNLAQAGRVHEIIVEGDGKGQPGRKFGRTSCNRIVHFHAPEARIGEILKVRIEAGHQNSLAGLLVTK